MWGLCKMWFKKFKHGKNLKLVDKKSIFIDETVVVGENVTIYENNRIEGNTVIGDNVVIKPGCYIIDCVINDNSIINKSQCESATVGKGCEVGPFARLRPNAKLGENVKVGNFVEIKNANVGDKTKVSHLAYVGDADVGANCNIGCGAIFVNYNGRSKNRTKVGDACFVGSNCNIIAPVSIENNTYICAGTTITEDLKEDDFVIGRVRQVVKENRAHEYLKEIK